MSEFKFSRLLFFDRNRKWKKNGKFIAFLYILQRMIVNPNSDWVKVWIEEHGELDV